MSFNTSRAYVPREEPRLCPPKRSVCPGRCKAGFCLNAQCLHSTRPEVVYCRPEVERHEKIYQQHIEQTVKEQMKMEREAFMASERKQMGMPEFEGEGRMTLSEPEKKDSSKTSMLSGCQTDFNELKMKPFRKKMRAPARPACMLDVPPICQSQDDYSQLSLFLRTSTMPGYGRNDTVSEYRDNHNMAVWNNRREVHRQINKMRRDWLSVWAEQNFTDMRLRKAWQERFSGGGKL